MFQSTFYVFSEGGGHRIYSRSQADCSYEGRYGSRIPSTSTILKL